MDQQLPQNQPAPQGPMPPVSNPTVVSAAPPPAPKASHKKMLLALLMVVVLALVLAALGYLYLQNNSSNNNQAAQVPLSSSPTATASPTPEVSVKDTNDLDKALNEVNSTNTSTIESEFNQAVTESKSL